MTGKNTIATNPLYRLDGTIMIAEPYTSIMNQAASEAWHSDNRDDQVFSNSVIEPTLRGFKKRSDESLKVRHQNSVRDIKIDGTIGVIHGTYNQVYNMSFDEMEKLDYIMIDECHVIPTDVSYRSEVVAKLLSHLFDFIAKRPDAKTRIIFMTGTPSVEVETIKTIMNIFNIGDKFQRLLVEKKYLVRPQMDLVYLNGRDEPNRQRIIMDQIKLYLKQGRKIVYVINDKKRIVQYSRELQLAISPDIRVGSFYSGSRGKCTNNILMGLFGEYDIVLTTSYFVNGINIERDGLSEQDILDGKKSKQKYGVVMDLGDSATRLNAMDTIQTINRFRNRICHATIYIPEIFKLNANPEAKWKYDANHMAKVLRGINTSNVGVLTDNLSTEGESIEDILNDIDPKLSLSFLQDIRMNANSKQVRNIRDAIGDEFMRVSILTCIQAYLNIYDDWFFSLEAFYKLGVDAELSVSIRQYRGEVISELEDIDHLELENTTVTNFLNDEEALFFLSNQIDPDKRFYLISSGKVRDPLNVSEKLNLSVVESVEGVYHIKGDFHEAQEITLNKVVRAHLQLGQWYGSDEGILLMRYLIHNQLDLIGMNSKSSEDDGLVSDDGVRFADIFMRYIRYAKRSNPGSYNQTVGYIRMMDQLSSMNIGFSKQETELDVTYHCNDANMIEQIKEAWCEVKYQNTLHVINTSVKDDVTRDELLSIYDEKELMKEMDRKFLDNQLPKLGDYIPMRISKRGKVLSPESFTIRKVKHTVYLTPDKSHWGNDIVAPMTADLMAFRQYHQLKMVRSMDKCETLLKSLDKHVLTGYHLAWTHAKGVISITEFLETYLFGTDHSYCLYKILDPLDWDMTVDDILKELKDEVTFSNDFFEELIRGCEYANYVELKLGAGLPSIFSMYFWDQDFDPATWIKPEAELIDQSPSSQNYLKDCEDKINKLLALRNDIPPHNKGTQKFWVGYHNHIPVVVARTKKELAVNTVYYAVTSTEGFLLKNKIPPKNRNVGIYNANTFLRDYMFNDSEDGRVINYRFEQVDADLDKVRDLMLFTQVQGLPEMT